MKRDFFLIFVFLVMIIGSLSIGRLWMENADPIQLKFFYWQTKELSSGSLVILSFVIGFALASLVLIGGTFSKYIEARRLRRENSALQKLIEAKEKHLAVRGASKEAS